MEWVETTGKDVKDATTRALDLLGIDTSDAEVEVLDEGETGWFGRVKSEARVRARIKPRPPQTSPDGRNRRGRNDRNGSDSREQSRRGRSRRSSGSRSGGSQADDKSKDNRSKDNRSKDGRRSGSSKEARSDSGGTGRNADQKRNADNTKQSVDESRVADNSHNTATEAGVAAADSGDRKSETSPRGGTDRAKSGSGKADKKSDNGKEKSMEEFPLEEQMSLVKGFLEKLSQIFDDSASVDVTEDDDTITASVVGDDLGLLIGPSGSTLDAVDEITRTVVQREANGRRYARIRVDVDEYKARRREALVAFTERLAQEVKDSGVRKALEPMRSADRKVVHDTVSDIDGVVTLSEGNDPRRYVVIAPE